MWRRIRWPAMILVGLVIVVTASGCFGDNQVRPRGSSTGKGKSSPVARLDWSFPDPAFGWFNIVVYDKSGDKVIAFIGESSDSTKETKGSVSFEFRRYESNEVAELGLKQADFSNGRYVIGFRSPTRSLGITQAIVHLFIKWPDGSVTKYGSQNAILLRQMNYQSFWKVCSIDVGSGVTEPVDKVFQKN